MASTQIENSKFFHSKSPYKFSRNFIEQVIGFTLLSSITLLLEVLPKWLSQEKLPLLQSISIWKYFMFYLSLSFGFFLIWRKVSSKKLNFEFSLYGLQIGLSLLWLFSLLMLDQILLSFVVFLFLFCASVINSYVFWQRKKVSTFFMLPLFFYEVYFMFLQLKMCIG